MVACYLIRFGLERLRLPQISLRRIAQCCRLVWTIGGGLYFMHVVSAFAFVHGFEHQAAYEHTAQQTYEVTGLHWGGGIYANYALLVLWAVDIIGWWACGHCWAYGSPRWYWGLQFVFAFMFFNATIVFGPDGWKWGGVSVAIAGFSLLIVPSVRRRLSFSLKGLNDNAKSQN